MFRLWRVAGGGENFSLKFPAKSTIQSNGEKNFLSRTSVTGSRAAHNVLNRKILSKSKSKVHFSFLVKVTEHSDSD